MVDMFMHGDAWAPWNMDYGNRSVFTGLEEIAVSEYIKDNYVVPGLVFTDSVFAIVAMDAYQHKLPGMEGRPDEQDAYIKAHPFQCSRAFIWEFKQRHGFSSRRVHYKTRSDTSDERRELWMEEMRNLFATVPLDHILNCDETFSLVYPNGLLVWAEKGAESVQAIIDGNEKDCLTVLATVAQSNRNNHRKMSI
jgi:hypothetical protein